MGGVTKNYTKIMTDRACYNEIFAIARSSISVKLIDYADYLTMCNDANYHCSWAYITIVANALTAYNELSSIGYFIKIRTFIPFQ